MLKETEKESLEALTLREYSEVINANIFSTYWGSLPEILIMKVPKIKPVSFAHNF